MSCKYDDAWQGNYRQVFDKYRISTVVFFLAQPGLRRIPAINEELLQDPEWRVVFLDRLSVIFVRASAQGWLPSIDKTRAGDFMRRLAGTAASR